MVWFGFVPWSIRINKAVGWAWYLLAIDFYSLHNSRVLFHCVYSIKYCAYPFFFFLFSFCVFVYWFIRSLCLRGIKTLFMILYKELLERFPSRWNFHFLSSALLDVGIGFYLHALEVLISAIDHSITISHSKTYRNLCGVKFKLKRLKWDEILNVIEKSTKKVKRNRCVFFSLTFCVHFLHTHTHTHTHPFHFTICFFSIILTEQTSMLIHGNRKR